MYQVFMETTAKAKQQAEEICLGQEIHEMGIRPVEIFAVPPCLFRIRGTLFCSVLAWVPPRSTEEE